MDSVSKRLTHSSFCVAVFVGWFCCLFLSGLLPGFATLYQLGLAMAFLHMGILLPYALFCWRSYSRRWAYLPLGRFSLRDLLLPALALFVLMLIHGHFARPETWMNELFRKSVGVNVLTILTLCLAAPIGEEIIFRGFVLNSSIGWGGGAKSVGIVTTSLLFAVVHMQYQSAITLVFLFVFSAILCVVRMHTRSLIAPIALHMLNNGWVVLALLSQ